MEKRHFFTDIEKMEFMKVAKKYMGIINDKSLDANTLRRKTIAWNRIACEYNTSAIAPYPASSKQLRRLWMNLKHRNKVSIEKFEQNTSLTSDSEHITENNVEIIDEDEEVSQPFFVSVEGNDTQDSVSKTPITVEKNQNHTFVTESEGRAFDVEFIDEIEEDTKSRQSVQIDTDKDLNQVKKSLLVREYNDRKRRQNELHMLQKRLLAEQIREARAKADLAELDYKQQKYLD